MLIIYRNSNALFSFISIVCGILSIIPLSLSSFEYIVDTEIYFAFISILYLIIPSFYFNLLNFIDPGETL